MRYVSRGSDRNTIEQDVDNKGCGYKTIVAAEQCDNDFEQIRRERSKRKCNIAVLSERNQELGGVN